MTGASGHASVIRLRIVGNWDYGDPMKPSVTLSVLLAVLPLAAQPQASCHNIGEIVTVTGTLTKHPFWEFRPFVPFSPFHPFFVCLCSDGALIVAQRCVVVPTTPSVMEAVGALDKFPSDTYLEVTGTLAIRQHGGITLTVAKFRNVDAEIKAKIAAWKRGCTLWQDESIKILFKQEKMPAFVKPNNIRRMQEGFKCGIFAAMVINQSDGSLHSVERSRSQEEDQNAWETAGPTAR